MAIDLYTNSARTAISVISLLAPHKYPRPAESAEFRVGRFDGPVDIFLDLPYHTKEANEFRSAVKQLFGVFLPTEKVWRVRLDPALHGDALMVEIINTLGRAGLIVAITPCMGYSTLATVNLAGFDRTNRVLLKTKFEEKDEILRNFPTARWSSSPFNSWSISIDDLLNRLHVKSGVNFIDERRWFGGITTAELAPREFGVVHVKHLKDATLGSLEFHTLANEKQFSVFRIIRCADPDFVISKQGFYSNDGVMWAKNRQVPAAVARTGWKRLVEAGFTTNITNPRLLKELEFEKTNSTANLHYEKCSIPVVHNAGNSTTNYALQA